MKIILFGYGKMGKLIESVAQKEGHEIISIYDPYSEFNELNKNDLSEADVVIDYTTPDSVVNNIITCFENNIPIVVGTTGWHNEFNYIKQQCDRLNATLLYASNFSIGVNLLFGIIDYISDFIKDENTYEKISVHETHHTMKKDSPSGTAVTIGEKIISNNSFLKSWYKLKEGEEIQDKKDSLPIFYDRVENIVGKHEVTYESEIDKISIKHQAFSRDGFAAGTLVASAWILGKQGIFTMKDVLGKQ
ncbi:MAG: 4-hydroxy-tetrahydrodipicolinate reductase [Bacteroidota bacterium]|nr:4-hydroxy-tetrahydrodipicolinate reductase [Bacteroidota bacterium]